MSNRSLALRMSKLLLSVFLFLCVTGASAQVFAIALSSDKSSYTVGDDIVLTLTFEGYGSFALYKDLSQNVNIWISKSRVDDPNWREEVFASSTPLPGSKPAAKGPYEEFRGSQVITRTIAGRLRDQDGKLAIELDGYGKAVTAHLKEGERLEISARYIPLHASQLDSLEDYSNHVRIAVKVLP